MDFAKDEAKAEKLWNLSKSLTIGGKSERD